MRWQYYRPGLVENAGLRVYECLVPEETQTATVYIIRYECCGDFAKLTHHQINRRKRNRNSNCLRCTQRPGMPKRQKEKLIPGYHGWVPPSHAIGWTSLCR